MFYKNANLGAGLNKDSDLPVPALDKPPVGERNMFRYEGALLLANGYRLLKP